MKARSKRRAVARIAKRFLNALVAKDLPKDVERYVKEVKKNNPGYDDAKAWATAWSIYCKNKNPDSPHCKKPKGDYFPGKKAAVSNQDMRRAMQLLVVGRLTMREAALRLTRESRGPASPPMSPQDAFLAVKAGAQLARRQGIEVQASAQATIFDDPAKNAVAMKVLRYMLGEGPEGTPMHYEDEIAPLLKGHRDLFKELTNKGFVDTRRISGEYIVMLHKRRPNDWKLLGIRG